VIESEGREVKEEEIGEERKREEGRGNGREKD